MLGALAAEAAPDHLRGRYLALIQLAWNVTGAVAPVPFAWLLERGRGDLAGPARRVSAVGGLARRPARARRCRRPRQPVTNRAEPVVAADPTPTWSRRRCA